MISIQGCTNYIKICGWISTVYSVCGLDDNDGFVCACIMNPPVIKFHSLCI